MHVLFGQWTSSDIAVIEISDSEWRVSDLRRREEDGMAVLGFVEATERGFEATGAQQPGTRRSFESLDSAVDYLGTSHIDQLRLPSSGLDE